jgi:hypothetical protein
VALTARSNRWWWDNLAGFDSSNFVGSDQIKKDNVGQLRGMAWWSRQYFVVVANQGGGRGGGRPGAAAAPPVDPNSPIGAIAFALPEKK